MYNKMQSVLMLLSAFVAVLVYRWCYGERLDFSLTLDRPLNTSYDYIIVGGGSAGLVLANRLTEDDDVAVLVLEAGSEQIQNPLYDIPYNAPKAQMTDADWQYYTVPQKYSQFGMKEQVAFWPRGKGLGGSTLVNGLVFIRGSRHDYDGWAANGCSGWGYEDVLPYFLKSEDMRTQTGIDKEYHAKGGPLAISDSTKSEVGEVFLDAGRELGYKTIDCNGNGGESEGKYVDDVLSLNNDAFHHHLHAIYPPELEIKETTESSTSASYLDLLISVSNGKLLTKLYDKRDDFDFRIVNFPFISRFCRMQAIIGDGVRYSATRAFLLPVIGRRNLQVAVNSHVTKVLIEKKKAKGVSFVRNGRKFEVFARKEVILSAGSVGSAQLLLLSGFGPKHHLEALGIPVVAELPVGEVLQDHMMFFLKADIQKPVSYTIDKVNSIISHFQYQLFSSGLLTSNAADEGNAFFRTDPNGKGRQPDIQFILVSSLAEHGNAYGHFNYIDKINQAMFESLHRTGKSSEGFSIAITLLHPKSRGTLRLKSTDPFDYPFLDPNYLADPEDVKTFIRGIRIFQKLLKTNSMKTLGTSYRNMDLPICKNTVEDSDEYWECLVRHLALTIYHPVSTCKMGSSNDSSAVVDSNLRVKGVDGLRVVDASVIPSLTSGNTMAPVYMIAEKAADIIRGKITVQNFSRKS